MDDIKDVRVLSEMLRGAAEQIRPTLGSEDDWMPIAFLVGQDDGLTVLPLTGWGSDEERAGTIGALAQVVVDREGAAIGLVSTIWMLTVLGGTSEEALNITPRPRDHPLRSEAVLVLTLTAEEVAMASAAIERNPDGPPTLREWELGNAEAEGAITTPLTNALRKVRDGRS
jgi:hypothetical protein